MLLWSLLGVIIAYVAAKDSNGLAPDIIKEWPKLVANVSYEGNLVSMGTILTPSQTVKQPTVAYKAAKDKYHTLAMIDPDAPSRSNPAAREWLHWLVINIPGDRVSAGVVLSKYSGPTPPKGTGYHRYALLVFEQKQLVTPDSSSIGNSRGNFHIVDYVSKHVPGIPVAGNFFLCRNDADSSEK